MLRNLRIHQKFVAVLLLPLVVLTVLAVGRIRSNVTESVRAGRVNSLVTFTVTLAGLAHELRKERDLSAVYLSDRRSGPESVVVQRELVDDVLARYQARLGTIDARRYSARVRDALAGVRRRLGELAADEVDDRGVARDLEAYTSLSRAKEQAAQQRGAIAGALASGRYLTADAQRLAVAGALESSAGRFVTPSPSSMTAATAGLELVSLINDFRVSLIDASGANAYPITSWTFILVRESQTDTVKARTLANLLWYMTHQGQASATSPHYAPLPRFLIQPIEAKIRLISGPGGNALTVGR